ncbi:MAG TPA: DivIVA domain-containing protein, partial [Ornithinibacter sp.]|nr:DivIVA domain-containing protein [Ornithinibacter sp.]
AVHTTPDAGLPPSPAAADVDTVRFDTALRGYRMDDVDARLDDLRDTLAERERTLLDLGGPVTEAAPVQPEPGPEQAAAPRPERPEV